MTSDESLLHALRVISVLHPDMVALVNRVIGDSRLPWGEPSADESQPSDSEDRCQRGLTHHITFHTLLWMKHLKQIKLLKKLSLWLKTDLDAPPHEEQGCDNHVSGQEHASAQANTFTPTHQRETRQLDFVLIDPDLLVGHELQPQQRLPLLQSQPQPQLQPTSQQQQKQHQQKRQQQPDTVCEVQQGGQAESTDQLEAQSSNGPEVHVFDNQQFPVSESYKKAVEDVMRWRQDKFELQRIYDSLTAQLATAVMPTLPVFCGMEQLPSMLRQTWWRADEPDAPSSECLAVRIYCSKLTLGLHPYIPGTLPLPRAGKHSE